MTKVTARIRRATANDIGALVALNREVQNIHVALFPQTFKDTDATALAAWFEGLLHDRQVTVLVALRGCTVAGYAVLRAMDRPENVFCLPRRCLYVDQICVTRSARSRGVGRALIQAAKGLARELGLPRLELDVWTQNAAAKQAFLAMGFTTYNEKMMIPLDGVGGTTQTLG